MNLPPVLSIQDYIETERLLSADNVNQEALLSYAREAADFGTNYQLPSLDYAINHYGQPDVAMFDFTSMYASENAALIREKHGHQLLVALVGDSLLEVRGSSDSGCCLCVIRVFLHSGLCPDRGSACVFTLTSCSLLAALLANGYRLCSRFSGSLRHCLDGEGLGTRQKPSGDTG